MIALFNLLALYASAFLACHAGPTPIEVFERPLIKSAPILRTNSHASQYAGRTVLGSGQASVTVSTRAVNSDSLIFPAVHAALVAAYQTMGRTSIASGLSTATVSTPAVYSGDIIGLGYESLNAITSGMALRVNSIVDGVSFAIATANSLGTVASGANVMWRIEGKDPAGVKVNSISPGGHFIFGWEDGRSRPFDATIMWEMRRST